MTDTAFREWLNDEVSAGRMTLDQNQDLLVQKGQFDADRQRIERELRGTVAGYIAGVLRSADTVHELLRQANDFAPGRMVYFEPIGFDLF
jgi:hypothetical protein